MRELLLLRHAKSDWGQPGLADHERDLAPRGVKAASTMGRVMREQDLAPDLVLCSDAVRARRTWELVSAGLATIPPSRLLATLYLASAAAMLRIVRRQKAPGRLMLVGHDPGMHGLATMLAGKGDPALVEAVAAKYPTGALALFRFPVEGWEAVAAGGGELVRFLRPRDLE